MTPARSPPVHCHSGTPVATALAASALSRHSDNSEPAESHMDSSLQTIVCELLIVIAHSLGLLPAQQICGDMTYEHMYSRQQLSALSKL